MIYAPLCGCNLSKVIKNADKAKTQTDFIGQVEAVVIKNVDIDNWEVHGSNSGCTGIVFNHPHPGDESVCLKNKITGEIKYKILGK